MTLLDVARLSYGVVLRRAAVLLGVGACSVPGPEAPAPAILSVSGSVLTARGEASPPEVWWRWIRFARPEEPVLSAPQAAPVQSDGSYSLELRAPPPPDARFTANLFSDDPSQRRPGVLAFGYLYVPPEEPDDPFRPIARSMVSDVFVLLLDDQPSLDPPVQPGFSRFDLGTRDLSSVQSSAELTINLWAQGEYGLPFYGCGSQAGLIVFSTVSGEEAGFRLQDASLDTFCWDADENQAAFGCPDFAGLLCQPNCTIEVLELPSFESHPPAWPCPVEGKPCDFEGPACREDGQLRCLDGRWVRTDEACTG